MKRSLFSRIEWTGLALVGVASFAFALVSSVHDGASCMVGGGLGVANFIGLRYIMARAINVETGEMNGMWAIALGAKFIVLAALIYFLLIHVGLAPMPFATGMGAVFLALIGESLRTSAKSEADPSDLTPEEG